MLGLNKAWYGDYSGNVVPFSSGGGWDIAEAKCVIESSTSGTREINISNYKAAFLYGLYQVSKSVYFGSIFVDIVNHRCIATPINTTLASGYSIPGIPGSTTASFSKYNIYDTADEGFGGYDAMKIYYGSFYVEIGQYEAGNFYAKYSMPSSNPIGLFVWE